MTPDPWLKAEEVAAELGVGRDTVLRAIKRGADHGGIDAFVDGRVIRIRRSELDRYIAAHTGRRDQLASRRRRTTRRTA